MVDDNNNPSLENRVMSRREFGRVVGAFTAGLLTSETAAAQKPSKTAKKAPPKVQMPEFETDENGIPKITDRFTLPVGQGAQLLGHSDRTELGTMYFGMTYVPGQNAPPGIENKSVILAGGTDPNNTKDWVSPDMILDARMVSDKNTMLADDKKTRSLKLGKFKINGVEQGSVILTIRLNAGQAVQKDHMHGTRIFVEEENGVKEQSDIAYASQKDGRVVVLLVPPDEHLIRPMGGVRPVVDIEMFRQNMLRYKTAKADEKEALYAILENEAWQIYARNMKDAGIKMDNNKLYADFKDLIAPLDHKLSKEKRLQMKKEVLNQEWEKLEKAREPLSKEQKSGLNYSDDELKILIKNSERTPIGNQSLLLQFIDQIAAIHEQKAPAGKNK